VKGSIQLKNQSLIQRSTWKVRIFLDRTTGYYIKVCANLLRAVSTATR